MRQFWMAVALAFATPALAEPGDDDETSSGGGMADDERVTGKAPPPLSRSPMKPDGFGLRDDITRAEFENLPYPYEAYVGAEVLKMDPAFVAGIQAGLELMYLRRYTDARDHFAKLEEQVPNTGIRAVADTLVWQALMLENFDYRYDKQYWTSSKQAKSDLERAIGIEGNEAWEHLLMAAILGIESIHTMRQGSYLSALQLAFQAMDHIEKSRAAAPEFIDLKLADGLYNYWRSVVTMSSKVLPDFGDHRVEGIEQMQLVEEAGSFVAPMAPLSLAFTWMEEDGLQPASASFGRNNRSYPDNIINNLVGAMVQTYRRQYDQAIGTLDHILAVDPNNARAHYWKGVALMRKGELDSAKASFETYLATDHLEKYQKSYTHYRLGQVYSRKKEFANAIAQYEQAVKVDGHKAAKRAIDRLKERKKEGKIDF